MYQENTPPKSMRASSSNKALNVGECAWISRQCPRIYDIELTPQVAKAGFIKGLREDIRN